MPPVSGCAEGGCSTASSFATLAADAGGGLDSTSLTASLPGETHTLGNALRALLIRNPDVEFAGYSVPHPTQVEMNLRIQTTEGPALGALQQALEELSTICEVLDSKYDEALSAFEEQRCAEEQKAESAGSSA
ncbi:DNA-directed RNA polymerase I [Cyclospora cayetanensis]|uniref:DNA-directed RNA polymerase I n=1 Tax=Cyclospora cayetanensis TaxID=88456 RepID=A0A1D3CWI8_9EIME|nr:DNA-directed RNA polymerase I [Cyclospora cayetanensis]